MFTRLLTQLRLEVLLKYWQILFLQPRSSEFHFKAPYKPDPEYPCSDGREFPALYSWFINVWGYFRPDRIVLRLIATSPSNRFMPAQSWYAVTNLLNTSYGLLFTMRGLKDCSSVFENPRGALEKVTDYQNVHSSVTSPVQHPWRS